MTKEPFTQDTLLEVYDANGILTLDLLADRLPTWEVKDIKARLLAWRYRGVLEFSFGDDGELEGFQYLRRRKSHPQELSEGRRLKLDRYFRQVIEAGKIIESPTANYNQRLKAMTIQGEAMREIPDNLFKELSEFYQ